MNLTREPNALLCMDRPGEGFRPIPVVSPTAPLKVLSGRETQCLDLIIEGLSQKQIALKIGITLKGVQWRLKMARAKVGVKSLEELVVWYIYWYRLDILPRWRRGN